MPAEPGSEQEKEDFVGPIPDGMDTEDKAPTQAEIDAQYDWDDQSNDTGPGSTGAGDAEAGKEPTTEAKDDAGTGDNGQWKPDSNLERIARQLEMDPAELGRFNDRETAEFALWMRADAMTKAAQQQQQQPQQPYPHFQPPQQPMMQPPPDAQFPGAQQPPQVPYPTPPNGNGFQVKLKEGEWDKEIVDTFNGMSQHFQGQIAQLQHHIAHINQQAQSWQEQAQLNSQAAAEAQFDQMLDSLGEEWGPVFGAGRGSELDRNSEQYTNRLELLDQIGIIASGYAKRSPDAMPGDPELFEQALWAKFNQHANKLARGQISSRLRDMRGRFTSRPTPRSDQPRGKPVASEEEDAYTWAKNFAKERGLEELI